MGYHNNAQVCVGYGIGAVTALGWLWCGENVVGPALAADPHAGRYVRGLVGFGDGDVPAGVGALVRGGEGVVRERGARRGRRSASSDVA